MDGQVRIVDRARWAQGEFGAANLGDVRRTRRLAEVAEQMAGNSGGSIPQQTERLADMPEVTFDRRYQYWDKGL